MGDVAAPAVLDRYAAVFRTRVERFPDSWPLSGAGVKHWEARASPAELFRLTSLSALGTASSASPPTIGTFGRRSWRTRSWTTGRSVHWFTRRLGEVGTRRRSVPGRDLRRAPRRSSEGVLEAITHCEEAMDVIAPLRLESKSASNSIGMLVDALGSARRRVLFGTTAHV